MMRRLAAAITVLCVTVMLISAIGQPINAHDAGNHPVSWYAQQATVTPLPTLLPPNTYVVQPGDTLFRIATRFNTTIQALMEVNSLTDANAITPGQTLILPPPSGVPAATPQSANSVGFTVGVTLPVGTNAIGTIPASVKDLGLGWVKLTAYWSDLETAPGNVDLGPLDALVAPLASQGTNILLTVTHAPAWARSTDVDFGPPADVELYAQFVGKLATHFAGKVGAFEIWEQPNLKREWTGATLGGPAYVQLLKAAYGAIKQANPMALVISAGLAPTGLNDGVNAIADREYLRQMYAAGLKLTVDAVGAVADGRGNPPDSTCCTASPGVLGWFNDRTFFFKDTLTDYRQIMAQNADGGRFIWVTRFGWGASDGVVTDVTQVNKNLGFVNFTDEVAQAQYTARAIEVGRALGFVGPMFLYNLNACQMTKGNGSDVSFEPCFFSLLDAGGKPRPVYDALKAARK